MNIRSIYNKIINWKPRSRKAFRKTVIIGAAVILALCILPTALAEDIIPVTGVSLDKDNVSIVKGTSLALTAAVTPSDATDRSIVWSSSSSDIASVDNGTVKGISAGSAVITAAAENGHYYGQCTVTVVQTVSGLSVDPSSIELCPGDTAELKATVTPSDASDKSVSWSSSDNSIVSVAGGKITANSTGEAHVTATSENGTNSVVCTADVVSPLISSSSYLIDRDQGILTGIPKFTSSGELLANLSNNPADLSLKKPDGSPYSGIAVGTGMILDLTVNGTIRDSLKLVVSGDEDGNGAVTISDYTLARLHILGMKPLIGSYLKACDVDGDGKITILDYTLIRLDIMGVKPISSTTPDLPKVSDLRINAFLDMALAQRGKPYVWGAEGPDSFDCSGFVYYCLTQTGYKIDRTTADMYSKNTGWQYVEKDKLQPGDLMFFKSDTKPGVIGHVGIYLGNGYLIHASSDYGCIIICPFDGWYSKAFSFGRRVFAD